MTSVETNIEKKELPRAWALIGFAGVTLAFLMWNGEEPSRISTAVALCAAYSIAAALLMKAVNSGLVTRPNIWIFSFVLNLLMATVITDYAWLRGSDSRAPEGYDPIRYDWAANELIGARFDISKVPTVTFNPAIIYYIAIIYRVFGLSKFYVAAFNACLVLAGLLFLLATIRRIGEEPKRWQWLAGFLLLPDILLHGSHGTKEPLSVFCICAGIYLSSRLVESSGAAKVKVAMQLGGLALLAALIRVPVGLTVIVISALYTIFQSRHRTRAILGLCIGIPVVVLGIDFAIHYFGYDYFSVLAFVTADHRDLANWEVASSKQGWNTLITFDNPFLNLATSPIRAAFTMVSPLPGWGAFSIEAFQESINAPNHLSWEQWELLFRGLSACVYVASVPFVVAAILHKRATQEKSHNINLHVVCFLVVLEVLGAGTVGMIEPRYRTLVLPSWAIVCGFGYLYGDWKKWLVPGAMAVTFFSLLYFILLPN